MFAQYNLALALPKLWQFRKLMTMSAVGLAIGIGCYCSGPLVAATVRRRRSHRSACRQSSEHAAAAAYGRGVGVIVR